MNLYKAITTLEPKLVIVEVDDDSEIMDFYLLRCTCNLIEATLMANITQLTPAGKLHSFKLAQVKCSIK